MGRIRSKSPQGADVDLVPTFDVSFQRSEHAVQLRLFFLVELATDPRQGRQDREGEPITAHLKVILS